MYFLSGPLPNNSVVLSQVLECLLTLIHNSWLPLMFSKLGLWTQLQQGLIRGNPMWPAPGCFFRELLCLFQPRMLQGSHQAWATLFVHFYLGFRDYTNRINLNPRFNVGTPLLMNSQGAFPLPPVLRVWPTSFLCVPWADRRVFCFFFSSLHFHWECHPLRDWAEY